jgi:hypothetical protein
MNSFGFIWNSFWIFFDSHEIVRNTALSTLQVSFQLFDSDTCILF